MSCASHKVLRSYVCLELFIRFKGSRAGENLQTVALRIVTP